MRTGHRAHSCFARSRAAGDSANQSSGSSWRQGNSRSKRDVFSVRHAVRVLAGDTSFSSSMFVSRRDATKISDACERRREVGLTTKATDRMSGSVALGEELSMRFSTGIRRGEDHVSRMRGADGVRGGWAELQQATLPGPIGRSPRMTPPSHSSRYRRAACCAHGAAMGTVHTVSGGRDRHNLFSTCSFGQSAEPVRASINARTSAPNRSSFLAPIPGMATSPRSSRGRCSAMAVNVLSLNTT